MLLTKRRESSANGKHVSISKPAPNSANATYKLGDYVIGKTIGMGTFGKVKGKISGKDLLGVSYYIGSYYLVIRGGHRFFTCCKAPGNFFMRT